MDITESISVTRAANGAMTVTVALQDGKLSSRWAVKAYSAEASIKAAVDEARREAARVLHIVREQTRTALEAVAS